ncbi:hypothetical protein [Flavobacterium davisii]|nr:hypothetical protein [Flavobacterium davisii]
MDQSKLAYIYETIRFVLAFTFLYLFNGWFKIDEIIPYGTYIIMSYFVFSLLASFYFVTVDFKQKEVVSI